VTVLFCDVARSTELGERLDPEALRRVMTRYFESMRAVLERHGGTVEKFIGDAVMAVFGVPVLHEDDALRAVRAADEMRAALDALNRELEADMGVAIAARIGVNTGPVVAAESGQQGQGMVTGDTVNTAARLQQAAQPGEILLGRSTYRLVRDAVTVEPLGDMDLKGKSEAQAAVRLLSVRVLADAHTRRLDSPMVGRGSEFAQLRQAYGRAVEQRTCQLFTLLGPAGVGKSRLVAEFLSSVSAEARVIRGRCLSYGEGITYWPIGEAVRQAAGIADEDSRADALATLDSLALAAGGPNADRVGPLVAEMIGLVPGSTAQEELFWALRTLFESLATERPLVVLIEDIHWAEPPLLDLIDYICDWSRDSPILLLCPARPELLESRPGWGGGKFNASALLLEPLDDDASDELIENLLGGAALPATLRERIMKAAEGNPLFVEEMLGMLVDEGRLRRVDETYELVGAAEGMAVPPTIGALLAARLERLSAGERSAAERGAVVGRIFELPAVIELAGSGSASDTRTNVMGLVRKELVRLDRSAASRDETFRFRHQLIRDAAYEAIPKEERAGLHERFAEWLTRRAGDRLPEYEEIVGYHLEQAYRYHRQLGAQTDDHDLAVRAARHLAAAARRAVARSDVRTTVNLMSRARELLPPDDPDRPLIAVDLLTALTETPGSGEAADALVPTAMAEADALGDERIRAHVAVQVRLLGGRQDQQRWRLGGEDRPWAAETEPIARRAIETFRAAGDEGGLAKAWRLLGHLGWTRGRIADEQVAVEEALRHAEAAGDQREKAELLFVLSRDLVQGPTPVTEGITRCEQVLRRAGGDRTIEGYMFHALGHLLARVGDFEAARAHSRRYRSILWESGQQIAYWFFTEVEADVELIAGNVDAAAEIFAEGSRKLADIKAPMGLHSGYTARALALAGRYAEATQAAQQPLAGDDWRGRALAQAATARVLAVEGRLDEAISYIDEAVAAFGETDMVPFRADVLMDRGDILARAGRHDEAVAATREALALYELKGDVVSAARLRRRLLG